MKNRRQFLVASSLAAVATAMPKSLFAVQQRLGGDVFSNASVEPYLQGEMTQAHFEKVIGSTFTIFLDDDRVDYLRLRAVTAGPDLASEAAKLVQTTGQQPLWAKTSQPTSFTVHFDYGGDAIPQDSYLLDHGTMGRFTLFLVAGSAQKCLATFCTFDQKAVSAPTRTVGVVPVVRGALTPTI